MSIPRLSPFDVEPLPAPVVVAGDVHLSESHPAVRTAFCAFVARRAAVGGTLVLLGDLFDYWLGRPQALDPFLAPVFEALAKAQAAGLHIVFQAGNRDFVFDGTDTLTLEIWPEVVRATVSGRVVLFTHGDLLCTSDVGYQRMRRLIRKRGGAPRLWVRKMPYPLAWRIAMRSRSLAKRATKRKTQSYMDIDYDAALAWLKQGAAEILVAGHVHTGVHHVLQGGPDDGAKREILVLKDWERGGGVVVFDAAGARLVAPHEA